MNNPELGNSEQQSTNNEWVDAMQDVESFSQKNEQENQHAEANSNYHEEINNKIAETLGQEWWLKKQRTPEEEEKIKEIVSQTISGIEDAKDANRFIEESPAYALGHLKELADKGADPLQIVETLGGSFSPDRVQELIDMGFSWDDVANRMDEIQTEEWGNALAEKK